MDNKKSKLVEFLDRSEDYPRDPIPKNERKSWSSIAFVWTGVYISIAAILDGLTVISGLSFHKGIIALILGFVTFIALTALQGGIGTASGLSTYIVAKQSFGENGSNVVSFISLVVNIGWFAINVRSLSESVHALWGGNVQVMSIIFGFLMVVTATLGYKGIEALSMPTVFYTFAFMTVSALRVLFSGEVQLSDLVNRAPLGDPVPMHVIISVLVGAMAAGAVNAPDIMRYSKSIPDNFKGLYLIGMPLAIIQPISAMILALYTDSAEFGVVMVTMGGIFGLLMVVLGAWTSNDNALYSASLAFTAMFKKFRRWLVAIVLGVSSSIIAAFIDLSMYVNIMLVFGSFLVPILGIMIADFYILPRVGLESGLSLKNHEKINKIAITVWFIGGIYATMLDFEILKPVILLPSVLKNMLVCAVIYTLLMKIKYKEKITD